MASIKSEPGFAKAKVEPRKYICLRPTLRIHTLTLKQLMSLSGDLTRRQKKNITNIFGDFSPPGVGVKGDRVSFERLARFFEGGQADFHLSADRRWIFLPRRPRSRWQVLLPPGIRGGHQARSSNSRRERPPGPAASAPSR